MSITAIAATVVGYQISNYSSEWIGGPVATILLVLGARGAWAFRTPTYRYYVVDTRGQSADDRSDVCNLVICTLEEAAAEFEADIPWSQAAAWPPDVRDAAEVLVTASGRTHTGEPYQQTGMMKRSDHAIWQAFAIFAGYAYDASVWSDSRVLPIVSLADEGTSVVVRLDDDERRRLEAAVEPTQIVELRESRTERRRARTERRKAF